MRIGWVADTDLAPPSVTADSPTTAFKRDLEALASHDPACFVHGGDAVGHADAFSRSHVSAPEEVYPFFWNLVDEVGIADRFWAIPGNHDVPIQPFLASSPTAVWRKEFVDHDDEVAVYLLNTAPNGLVTGGLRSYDTAAGGYGVMHGYVPYADLRWLEGRLAAVPEGYTKLVFSHHHLYFSNNEDLATYSPDRTIRDRQAYDLVLNAHRVHALLSSFQNVYSLPAHLYQNDHEGHWTVDGVTYVWKKHYHYPREDDITTTALVEAGHGDCSVTTYDHDGTEERIL